MAPFFFQKKNHRNIRVARVVKVVRVVGWWLPQYQHMCVSLPQGGQRKTHLGRSWGAHGGGGGGGRVRKEAHRAGQLGWEAQLSCWGAVGPLMGWSGALLGRRGRVEGGFRSRPLFFFLFLIRVTLGSAGAATAAAPAAVATADRKNNSSSSSSSGNNQEKLT